MQRYTRLPLCAALLFALASLAGAMTYEVTITNDIPGGLPTGQPFSPPVAAVHEDGYEMFAAGAMATAGLEAVAEEGNPSILQMEAESSPDVHSVVVGTGPFFGTQTMMIEGEPGRLFSIVWMLGRSNDLFAGLYDVPLPMSGVVLEFETEVWDAGTELNTGLIEHLGFYGYPMSGPEEDAPIMTIGAYTVFNDPEYGELSWEFPPSAHVTIVPMDPTPVESAAWGELKALYR